MSEMIKRIRGLMIGRWQRIGPQIRDPASYRLRTIANVPLSLRGPACLDTHHSAPGELEKERSLL